MSEPGPHRIPLPSRDRERDAREEMDRTRIPPAVAGLLTLLFLATLGVDLLTQLTLRPAALRDFVLARPEPWRSARTLGPFAINRILRGEMAALEELLERQSAFAALVRQPAQSALLGLGIGNEIVEAGRDGWLQFKVQVDHVLGPGFLDPERLAARRRELRPDGVAIEPDPRPALKRFGSDLGRRGIALLLVPCPGKLQVAPETLVRLRPAPAVALHNPSFEGFRRDLESAGIQVFDPLPALRAEYRASGRVPYLRGESHWAPAGMQAVARALARQIRERFGTLPGPAFRGSIRRHTVEGRSNLLQQLRLDDWLGSRAFERVTVEAVLDERGRAWRPDPAAAILLLGDSFTNIYSTPAASFGVSAGLAEHLSLELGQTLDRIAYEGRALETRTTLREELAAGRDRLAGKRLVILEIESRILSTDDWPVVALPDPRPLDR